MGLIKKLLGGLFSFLAGLGKLLGLGKSSEYFLEADAADNSSTPAAPAAAPTPAAAPSPAAQSVAAAAPVAVVVADAPASAAAAKNGKVSKNGKTPEPAAAPAAKVEPLPPAADATFAPKFVMLNSNRGGRRRPGPSLNPYLDMARQVRPQG